MPTEEQKDKAKKLDWYMFIAVFPVGIVSFAIMGAMNSVQPGAKIFVTAFAFPNGETQQSTNAATQKSVR